MVREGCQEDAYELVTKSNALEDREYVENPRILALISSLTALMMQVQQLALGGGGEGQSQGNAVELQALQESLRDIKLGIHEQNVGRFEDCVEAHVQHIQSGLTQMGNLHAFNISPQRQQQQESSKQGVKTESDS